MEETKTCFGCKKTLPHSDFYLRTGRKTPLSKCKKCHTVHVNRNIAQLRSRDPIARATTQKKAQAKRHGIPFALTRDYLAELWEQQDGKCAALGIPIEFNGEVKADQMATIDRIIPHLGYIQGNVRWLSWLANRVKTNCTDPEVFRSVADYVEQAELIKEPQFDFSFTS